MDDIQNIVDYILHDKYEDLENMLNNGFNPNQYYNETSILSFALINHKMEAVKIMLNNNANPDLDNPFFTAVFMEDYDIMQAFIDKNADINVEYKGETPLSYAVNQNDIDLIKFLIENGVDPNKQFGKEQNTALLHAYATDNVNYEVIKMLIESGTDLTIENVHSENIFAYTCNNTSIDYKFLLMCYDFMNEKISYLYKNFAINIFKYVTRTDLIINCVYDLKIFQELIKNETFKTHFTPIIFNHILKTCFVEYDVHTSLYLIQKCINIVYTLDIQKHILESFFIKYMFIHKTQNELSKFYENKNIKVFTNDIISDNSESDFNERTRYVIRIFDSFDIPLNINNVYMHTVNKSTRMLTFTSYYVPKLITNPNYEEYKYEINNKKLMDNLTMKNIYNVDKRTSYTNTTMDDEFDYYKMCSYQYLNKHKNELYELLNFYTHIGDRCIHNILRNIDFLNTKEYCKYDNHEIINKIIKLNNYMYDYKLYYYDYFKKSCDYFAKNTRYVYRGTQIKNLPLYKDSEINSLRNQFVSFTTDNNIAETFGSIILRLELSDTDICLPIEDIKLETEDIFFSHYPKEKEWLCPLNTTFVVSENAFLYDIFIIIPIKIKTQTNIMKDEIKIMNPNELYNTYSQIMIKFEA